ncbi:Crp/Fnr family transcriptional regulator [Methylobacterium gossipiicola]|uniref:cAMP-binding domain of CRP or a regulatory subunit of cAMP-dependent protein kinases n=1 Tax=Methylobacterium gossipiicola TaxID=582675 RepID=A0A1I2R8H9_9HYPH|nr:Crp/Fnr family transcriptional regulator [Methylobacterium gossipiicola]SFG34897.1 cAMP-binding domain of CRP or a regulatory subunit of cAMP-dependent protein kinases [Methylobacterium gossipiicola]
MTSPFDQSGLKNTLLANLPPDLFARLAPHLSGVSLEQEQVIERPNAAIAQVCFPGPGLISVIARTPGGARLETGLIGPEGMTGVPLLYGLDSTPHESFVQIPCRVLRIAATDFREAVESNHALHLYFLRYAHVFSIQVAQTALCNGRFTIEQRLARWLLMCHDRVDREDIALTHEFLSLMLGVRRAGVTTALRDLVTLGALVIHRGIIVIRDRRRLLEASAEAYGVPEAQYAALMPTRSAGFAA